MVEARDEPDEDGASAPTATAFLVALAHDVRAPLAALMHQIQLLTSDGLTDELRQRSLSALEANASEVGWLLQTLDDIERVVQNEIEVRPAPTDSGALLHEIDGPEASVVAPTAAVPMVVDEALIRRIVRLLLHAVTGSGDRPHIELRIGEDGVEIEVSSAGLDGDVDVAAEHRLDVHLRLACALTELHGGRLDIGRHGASRRAVLRLPAVGH